MKRILFSVLCILFLAALGASPLELTYDPQKTREIPTVIDYWYEFDSRVI